jgi:hypothetical protein
MIDIFKLYQDALSSFNTSQNGILRPERDFIPWLHDISLQKYQELVAEFEKTQIISDSLNPFLQECSVPIISLEGEAYDKVVFPNIGGVPYDHLVSIKAKMKKDGTCPPKKDTLILDNNGCPLEGDELEFAKRDADNELTEVGFTKTINTKWAAALNHTFRPPSPKNPIFTQSDGYFKIAPKRLGYAIVTYFTKPVEPVFKYTIVNAGTENEYIQYVPTGSVHLQWPENMRTEFITALQKKYAVASGQPGMYQAAQADAAGNVP